MNEPVRFAVYEALNETLRESYLFNSSLELAAVIANQCELPPEPIAHWKRGQEIAYREIERDLDPASARAFIRHYSKAIARSGWKILVD